MARHDPCPSCGGRELTGAGNDRFTCAACGATLAYRIHWVRYLVAVVLLGAALGAGTALAFDSLLLRQAVMWPLFAVGLWFCGRHFRAPQRVS